MPLPFRRRLRVRRCIASKWAILSARQWLLVSRVRSSRRTSSENSHPGRPFSWLTRSSSKARIIGSAPATESHSASNENRTGIVLHSLQRRETHPRSGPRSRPRVDRPKMRKGRIPADGNPVGTTFRISQSYRVNILSQSVKRIEPARMIMI
jgi:hypothetical protein